MNRKTFLKTAAGVTFAPFTALAGEQKIPTLESGKKKPYCHRGHQDRKYAYGSPRCKKRQQGDFSYNT